MLEDADLDSAAATGALMYRNATQVCLAGTEASGLPGPLPGAGGLHDCVYSGRHPVRGKETGPGTWRTIRNLSTNCARTYSIGWQAQKRPGHGHRVTLEFIKGSYFRNLLGGITLVTFLGE